MASKSRLTELVRALDVAAVAADLAARPDLLGVRDERGRTWLHLTASLAVGDDPAKVAASLAMAQMLLDLGLDIDDAAFTEGLDGAWRATPLWYAISRGRNLALARFLLARGCDPDHSLFAAAWNRDVEAIRLLREHGAPLKRGLLVESVGWSRFEAAEEFLRQGADPDETDPKGRTALHLMLGKGTEAQHLAMMLRFGARTDIPGPDGRTAADILKRKKDPAYRGLLTSSA